MADCGVAKRVHRNFVWPYQLLGGRSEQPALPEKNLESTPELRSHYRAVLLRQRLNDLERIGSIPFNCVGNASKRFFLPPFRKGCCQKRSEEHTSELQSRLHLVCRLLLEKKNQEQQHHRLRVV